MNKIERLVESVVHCASWEMRKHRAKTYFEVLSKTLRESKQLVAFLNLLAQKDILAASYASRKECRHIVAPYLQPSAGGVDIQFIECCLFLDFTQDIIDYIYVQIEGGGFNRIRGMIEDIRDKTNDVLLLRFLRILNQVGCKEDYIDDVFLDCPIDTPDFQQEEHRFCRELFEEKKYLQLYEYLATREELDILATILGRKREEINKILKSNPNFGSVRLLLFDIKHENGGEKEFVMLLDFLDHVEMDSELQKLCIFLCCLNACSTLGRIPDRVTKELKKLTCSSDYLLRYRKHIGFEEIICFKKLLLKDIESEGMDNQLLLNFLRLISDNNTFSENFPNRENIKPLENKNKKYLRDNMIFRKRLDNSYYSSEEKEYIIRNTHIYMYTGIKML